VSEAGRGASGIAAIEIAADDVPFSTTILVRDTCLCMHLQRAARSVARIFDDALRPLGLGNGQFSILMSLNRPEPPTIGAVAELLSMDRTTLTAALKPLERRGLLAITADPDDRRSRRLSLTAAGRALLAAAVPIWKATHAAIDDRFAARDAGYDADVLRRSLRAMA